MALYVTNLTANQQSELQKLQRAESDPELAKRASIVLLSAQRKPVHEISARVGLHPINVRKWIHRFNRLGVRGLYPRRSPGRPRVFDDSQRQAIVDLATTEPVRLGLDFASWSLQRLRLQLIRRGHIQEISAETIRQELLKGGFVYEGRRWTKAGA